MAASENLKDACYRLLRQFPLHQYRVPVGNGGFYALNVRIDVPESTEGAYTLCREILTLGQLLDTQLTVTISANSPADLAEEFLQQAPYLDHFVQISVDGSVPEGRAQPEEDYTLARLLFISRTADDHGFRRRPDAGSPHSCGEVLYHYIVVMDSASPSGLRFMDSQGQEHEISAPEVPASMEAAGKEHGVREPSQEPEAIAGQNAASDMDPLEEVAFHLHYTYAKTADFRCSYEQILHDFRSPYNYHANIKAAIHIRSKLACCGIYEEDPHTAAEKFAALMDREPEIVDRISALEHDRWVMDKVLSGYRQMEDVSWIYQNGAATHCSKEGNLWHSCLLPCDRTGRSRLTEQDWLDADRAWKTSGEDWNAPAVREVLTRDGRDPLDQLSLRIHLQCGRLARERQKATEAILSELRAYLLATQTQRMVHDAARPDNLRRGVPEAAEDMIAAIHQMWHRSQNAASLYRMYAAELRTLSEGDGQISRILERLDTELAPLTEYVANKDYKELDRLFVRQIPYDLTLRCGVTICKVLSGHETTDFYSSWAMESAHTIYLAAADSREELLHIYDVLHNIRGFFRAEEVPTVFDGFIFVPKAAADVICSAEDRTNNGGTVLVAVPQLDETTLSLEFLRILERESVDYLDVTGADPLLSLAAQTAAKSCGAGIFYVRGGRMISLHRARELEYEAPRKEISVQDMFRLSGAVLEESESGRLGNFADSARNLWEIAFVESGSVSSGRSADGNGKGNAWDTFCKKAQKAYHPETNEDLTYTFRSPGEADGSYQTITAVCCADGTHELLAALDRLERQTGEWEGSFVRSLQVATADGGKLLIRLEVREDVLDPDRSFQQYLQERCDRFRSGHYYAIKTTEDGRRQIVYHNFQMKGMICEKNEVRIFEAMRDRTRPGGALVSDYKLKRLDDGHRQCSCSFSSREVVSCIQLSGRILEYYIYYSALLDGHFHDVEMGFKYQHSGEEDAAENELDVICTKGMSSLFISAKMANIAKNFNYILYEILLQAQRFGIHGRAVLAAPFCSQFDAKTGDYSAEVKRALSRKVYLLGGECFRRSGDLGRVLDNIMDGREDWCDFLKERRE